MVAGATTAGFDINLALTHQSVKKDRVKKKKKVKRAGMFEMEEKTPEEKKAEAEWNKQMLLNMQYESGEEGEEEGEE